MDLNAYKGKEWNIELKAASFPGTVAYDAPNGGICLHHICGETMNRFLINYIGAEVHWKMMNILPTLIVGTEKSNNIVNIV